MTTATKTIETKNTTIKISLTRKVTGIVAYMDGYNIPTGREIYERYDIQITRKSDGVTVKSDYMQTCDSPSFRNLPAGAYACVGNSYISQEMYDLIKIAMSDLDAELGKTAEYIELEAAAAEKVRIGEENMARMAAERKERESHTGWCKRCDDYTYGDCGHS